MLVKDQSPALEPDLKSAEQTPVKKPDFLEQAKSALEKTVAGVPGGLISPKPKHVLGLSHPTAQPARVASILHAQQTEGNYYVQKAISDYQKQHPLSEEQKLTGAKPKVEAQKVRHPEKQLGSATTPRLATKTIPKKADKESEQKKKTPQAKASVEKPTAAKSSGGTAKDGVQDAKKKSMEAQAKAAAKGTAVKAPPNAVPETSTVVENKGPQLTKKLAAPKGTSVVNKGGGAGDPVQEWKGKVQAKVSDVKPGTVTAGGGSSLKDAADKSADQRDEAARKLPDDASKAITPPKEVQGLPAIPDDVTKAALKSVDEKVARALDPQKLPDLAAESPLHHIPVIGKEAPPPPKTAAEIEDEKKSAEAGKKKDEGQEKDKKKEVSAQQTEEEKEAEKKKLIRTGATVKDEPAPAADVGDVKKVDIASVVARLIAEEKKYSDTIVDDARKAAFPGVGEDVKNSFGQTLYDEELAVVDAELRRVAETAGVEKSALDAKISERRKELADQNKKVEEDRSASLEAARKKIDDSSKSYIDSVNVLRNSMERSAMDRAATVKGSVDAEKIRAEREQLIDSINKKLGTGNVNYDSAAKRLKQALDTEAGKQIKAYKVAALEDEQELNKDADTDQKKEQARVAYRPTKYWLDDQTSAVYKSVETSKVAIDTQVENYKKELETSANNAREQIRDWAAKQLGYERGFFQKLFDWISDWLNKAKIESDAWATKRAEENTAAVTQDGLFLQNEVAKLAKMTDEERQAELGKLDDEQFIIIKAFFESGGDAVAVMAARLMSKIGSQQRPELVKKLEQEVLACNDFSKVDAVAVGLDHSFENQAKIKADRLHDAFEGPGTNEQGVFDALSGLTAIQGHDVELAYSARWREDLKTRMKDELDDWATLTSHDIDRANALLAGDDAKAIAVQLDDAMWGPGTDEDTIFKALRNKSPAEIAAIKKAYKEKYGKDLETELHGELDDWFVRGTHDVDRMHALLASDSKTADAIAIDQAMHGGWLGLGLGTDRKGIEDVYAQQQAELEQEAAAKGWDTAKLKAEIKKLHDNVGTIYKDKYKVDLSEAYQDELSGSELELIKGLHDQDLAKISAARINIEHNSIFYADDKVINKALEDQYTTERENKKRDLNLLVTEEMDADRAAFGKDEQAFYKKWTPEYIRKRRKDADNQAAEEAKAAGAANFDKLEKEYDTQYKGKFTLGTPSFGLRKDVLEDTQLTQNKKATKLLDQKGYLSDIQEIRYAIQGAGTDEDVVNANFKGTNKEEMADLRKRWAEDQENKDLGITEDLDTFVLGDYSGRDKKDMELTLKYGEAPDNPNDQLAKAREMEQFEHEAWSSRLLGGRELEVLHGDVLDLETKVNEFNEFSAKKNEPNFDWKKYSQMKGSLDSQMTVVQSSVTSHRKTIDVISDTAAQVIGAVVTAVIVVLAIIADVGTAGGAAAATPAEAAAISGIWSALGLSLAGTALTMTAKAVIKGTDAYGWEEVGTDAAIGLVDALLSIATAGTAGKILKGSPMLLKMAEKQALGKVIANFMAHAAEGALQAAPGALLGSALNKENYKEGNAILNILEGAAGQVAGAAVMSGAVGAFHATLKDSLLIKARTDPEFQNRIFKRFEAQPGNRGKTRADFLAQLDHLISTQTTSGFKDPKLQDEMRAKLLEHIPYEQKATFAKVPIEILPEDEFKAFTKSESGRAVAIFRDGKPVIVMKAGSDLAELSAEGIHLMQAHDPATAAKVKKLDESVLQHWDKLSLDKQLDLYKTKVELEIDAHERLIQALEAQKPAAKDPAKVAEQIERAQANLDNLKKRQVEVNAITSKDEVDIQAGSKPRPDYLDQPARLFSKDPKIEEAKTIKPGEVPESKAAKRPKKQVEPAEKPAEKPDVEKLRDNMETLQKERTQAQRELDNLNQRKSELNRIVERETKLANELEAKKRQASGDERAELSKQQNEAYTRRKEAWEKLEKIPSPDELNGKLKRLDQEIEHTDILLNPKEHRAALPCFSADTMVWTPRGPIRIDQLRAGDAVLAYDFYGHKTVENPVLEVFQNRTQHFYQILVDGKLIQATGQHPFWSNSLSCWVAVRHLSPGCELKLSDGKIATVESISVVEGLDTASYNLSIARASNYFVGPGVLVHNQGVDLHLGNEYVIYRGTYNGTDAALKAKFADKVYIGQTTVFDEHGKPRGHTVRQGEHQAAARLKLKKYKAGKLKLSPEDVEFYTFMADVKLEPIVRGIATQAQADFLEQRNMDIERKLHQGESDFKLMNRREEIKSEDHMKRVTQEIESDPQVQAKGYCPK